MNIEHFIAKRIALSNSGSFTKVIIRIAIAAIAVSLTVMILTTAIIAGFKKEITEKIFGFWGHIHITDSNINRNFELSPIEKNEIYYDQIRDIKQIDYEDQAKVLGYAIEGKVQQKTTLGGVKGVYPYIISPAMLSTKDNFHGVLLKGVDADYNWSSMNKYIIDGKQITYLKDSMSVDLLISKNIADKMFLKTGDKVVMSFIEIMLESKKDFRFVEFTIRD